MRRFSRRIAGASSCRAGGPSSRGPSRGIAGGASRRARSSPARLTAKPESVPSFRYNNTRISGSFSSARNGKRSLDEPFSRQLRQQISEVHMQQSLAPQSLPNGMTHDSAMQDLANSGVDILDYCIANALLQDLKTLIAYSHLPTLQKKIGFLRLTWRLKHDPVSCLALLPPI